MKNLKLILFFPFLIFFNYCSNNNEPQGAEKIIELTPHIKKELIEKTKEMAVLDQQYRTILSLGTLDKEIIKKDKEMRESATIDEYMHFLKSVKNTLTENQVDSLSALQHELDFKNYQSLKSIVKQFGYPSKERLETEEEKIYPILLHPPIKIKPKNYLAEMSSLLKPEVEAGRMKAKMYATFFDNIKVKVLKEPQLYGTNSSFDQQTMSMKPPKIVDLEQTNRARKEIGLTALKEGEFLLME